MFRKMLLLAGLALALLAGAMVLHDTTSAAQPQTPAANAAVQYIKGLQHSDGGFPSSGTDSSPSASLDAAFALKAAGVDAANVALTGGVTLGNYLSAQTAPAGDAGALAKLSLGLSLIGLDGAALVDEMRQYVNNGTDGYGADAFDEAFYVFALVAAGAPHPVSAAYVRSIQKTDGGWEFADGFGTDSNTTAIVLQALLAAGGSPTEQATRNALTYLATTQNDDGGFGFTATDDSDANSTALVIQALVAAGENIDANGPWTRSGHTPLDGLLGFRNAATGAFQYAGQDNAFATYQALPALMLAPFPDLQTRVVSEPTPQAPTAVVITPATSPAPAATPTIGRLPSTGGGPARGDSAPWMIAAALAGAGALALSAATARRR